MGKLYHLTKEILRLLANHTVGNSLRIVLLRASGVVIGKKVFTNQGLTIVDNGNRRWVIIEDYVTFAPNITLITKSAPGHIHPSLIKENLPLKEGKIRIREGTWIGTNVTILPGVIVGKCCLIGAGSVVTKDVPDYTVVAGVPAKEIRRLK